MPMLDLHKVLALALAASGAGCFIDSDYQRTRYRCEQDARCPDGFSCLRGYCEPTSAGNQPSDLACGTTSLLRDDFEVVEPPLPDKPRWYQSGNGAFFDVYEANGRLIIELTPDVGGFADMGYRTQNLYMFRSSSVAIEVPAINPHPQLSFELEIKVDDANQATIRKSGDTLVFEYRVRSERYELVSIPYEPGAHRWWRLRESNDVLFWETSPDGMFWTVQASASSTPFTSLVYVSLGASVRQAPDTSLLIELDNLNTNVTSSEGWCPADVVTDDFNDALIGSIWHTWDGDGCRAFEREGKIELEVSTDGPYVGCGFSTGSLYDMTGNAISAEVVGAADAGVYTLMSLVLTGDEQNHVDFELARNDERIELRCLETIKGEGNRACTVTYDPVQHQWWRMRTDEQKYYWETSPDGKTWTTLFGNPLGELSFAQARIQLWTWAEPGDGGEPIEDKDVHFDNLNLGLD